MPSSLLLPLLLSSTVLLIAHLRVAARRARYPLIPVSPDRFRRRLPRETKRTTSRACLESLLRLRYPRELLEILVIDDHSTDRTADIVARARGEHSSRALVAGPAATGQLQGKPNALAWGSTMLPGDIVLFTDADCRVSGSGRRYGKYYAAGGRDCGGVHALAGQGGLPACRPWTGSPSFPWRRRGAVGRYPLTAVGTTCRSGRSAYEQVGGYRGSRSASPRTTLSFTPSRRERAYRAAFPMDPGTLVQSDPCADGRSSTGRRRGGSLVAEGMEPRNCLSRFAHTISAFCSVPLWCWMAGLLRWTSWVLLKLLRIHLCCCSRRCRVSRRCRSSGICCV